MTQATLQTIYRINEIPGGIDFKQVSVLDKEQATEILQNGEYTVGWFYRPSKNTRWLIVKKQEYDRNQY